jgi:lipopolysaccharide transport system ATP-binding protein
MWYGIVDIVRDISGMRSYSQTLRAQEFLAVEDVSFELKEGECLGLIGPNGAGKSTVLKMINGIVRPDQGSIRIRGQVGALIEVGAGFHPDLTGRENIYINASIRGMSRRETDSKFERIVEFASIGDFLETPVKYFSSGMFVRLGMAVAMHTDPQILLIDEVFSVGDIQFQAKCLNRLAELRRNGVSFVLVSHNIDTIAGHCDRVLVLNHGRLYACGDPQASIHKYVELMMTEDHGSQNVDEAHPGGSGRVCFESVIVRDESGNRVDSVDATSPFYIDIDYVSASDVKDVELLVGMYGGREGLFLRASNRMYGERLDLCEGKGKIVVWFPYLPRNNGRLHVTLTLWSKGRCELLEWRREIYINVKGCSLSAGAVWVRCSFGASVGEGSGVGRGSEIGCQLGSPWVVREDTEGESRGVRSHRE